jgi:hypothetical protein
MSALRIFHLLVTQSSRRFAMISTEQGATLRYELRSTFILVAHEGLTALDIFVEVRFILINSRNHSI